MNHDDYDKLVSFNVRDYLGLDIIYDDKVDVRIVDDLLRVECNG